MTSEASRNATSSPASEDGLERSGSPAGQTTDLFGQALAPADPSASREKWRASPTRGTYGPLGFGSSKSAALQSSLENRLRARLRGSALCTVTWRRWITPWGPSRSRPRAQVRTTCEIDSGLWPMPKTSPSGEVGPKGVALWATASNRDWKDSPGMAIERPDGSRMRLDQLPRQAMNSVPLNGSSDQTKECALLNPDFVCWLMRYQNGWIS